MLGSFLSSGAATSSLAKFSDLQCCRKSQGVVSVIRRQLRRMTRSVAMLGFDNPTNVVAAIAMSRARIVYFSAWKRLVFPVQ
jgi:hypothetical protein